MIVIDSDIIDNILIRHRIKIYLIEGFHHDITYRDILFVSIQFVPIGYIFDILFSISNEFYFLYFSIFMI